MMKRNLLLLCLAVVLASMPSVSRADGEEKVIRLGIIGLDTSHVIAFTSYLNNPKNNTGCRVVAGFPGGSPDMLWRRMEEPIEVGLCCPIPEGRTAK